jgi:transposase
MARRGPRHDGLKGNKSSGAPKAPFMRNKCERNVLCHDLLRLSIKGVWWRIFEAMSDDPDFEYLIVDSIIVRAHQHAAGAKKKGLKIKRSAARAAA